MCAKRFMPLNASNCPIVKIALFRGKSHLPVQLRLLSFCRTRESGTNMSKARRAGYHPFHLHMDPEATKNHSTGYAPPEVCDFSDSVLPVSMIETFSGVRVFNARVQSESCIWFFAASTAYVFLSNNLVCLLVCHDKQLMWLRPLLHTRVDVFYFQFD